MLSYPQSYPIQTYLAHVNPWFTIPPTKTEGTLLKENGGLISQGVKLQYNYHWLSLTTLSYQRRVPHSNTLHRIPTNLPTKPKPANVVFQYWTNKHRHCLVRSSRVQHTSKGGKCHAAANSETHTTPLSSLVRKQLG